MSHRDRDTAYLLWGALLHHLGPVGLQVDFETGRTSLWSDGAEGPREPREVILPNPIVDAEIRSTDPDATRTSSAWPSKAEPSRWAGLAGSALAGMQRGQVEPHHLVTTRA